MIRRATKEEYDQIIILWELSVRATHLFLPEDYLQLIKRLLPDILPQIPTFVNLDNESNVTGFLGVQDDKIEMLFIHPDHMKKGIGKKLLQYALQELKASKVDVNEHNEAATAFYKYVGFEVISRSEVDGLGKPFPLLHMEIRK